MINLAAVRAGIASILAGIPELKRVNPLEAPGENVNNLPCAYVHRGTVNRPPVTLFGEGVGVEGLGQYSQLVEWDIAIYATLNGYAAAQELDDLYTARMIEAFDAPNARLIDPNGPGVVNVAKLHQVQAFVQVEDANGQPTALWVTQALVNTLIIE